MPDLSFSVRRFSSAPFDAFNRLSMLEEVFFAMVAERVGEERWSRISSAPTFQGMQFEHRIDLLLDEAFRPGEYSVGH